MEPSNRDAGRSTETVVERIRRALAPFDSVLFAVLFGSAVTGRLREDSDLDLGVYFESDGFLEIELDRESVDETAIQVAVERATDRNIDLLVLNRAPATVSSAAILTGRSIVIRDSALYSRYALAVTSAAIDFLQTEGEIREIRARSRSLAEMDRERLRRILDFIDEELQDRGEFQQVGLPEYRSDRDLRRNLDRWVETLTNAAIDIGKIVIGADGRPVPRTYGQILADLETVQAFTQLTGRLARLAPLRNLLAHEYLDLRFDRVKRFVDSDVEAVAQLRNLAEGWMESAEHH